MKTNSKTIGFTLALVASTLATAIQAAPTSSSSDTPTSSAYTNQLPPVTVTVDTYTPSVSSSNDTSSTSSFGTFSSNSSTYTYYYRNNYFYFPPTLPALGEPIGRRTSSLLMYMNSPAFSDPITPQLSPYVGELFYPPLATHLHNEDLTRGQHAALATYRGNRAALVSALRTKLESLKDADGPTRERALVSFAREQAAPIDALEQEAETIRADLVQGGFFKSGVAWDDWDAVRSWRLGDDLRYESRLDEFKVIRAAAYFYANLIPGQRRLLQELAMELDEPLTEPTAAVALDAPEARVYFSPETARVFIPRNLPADLGAKLAAYQKEKAALKEEIRAAIYKLDRSFFYFTRKSIMNPLADAQAPRIAALENLAEEIRRGLATVPNSYRPRRVTSSNELADRVEVYMRERQTLLRALQDKLALSQKMFPTARIEFTRIGEGQGLSITANRKQSKSESKKIEAYKTEIALFNDEQEKRFVSLGAMRAAIRADLAKLAPGNTPGGTASVDDLLRRFAREYQERSIWEQYSDYDAAVFEPGLSPGQRRLLLVAAFQTMDPPLPRGSRQP